MGHKNVGLWLWNNLQKREAKCCGYALSRKDEDVESLLYAISILQPEWVTEARDEWKNDEEVWKLIRKLEQVPSASDTFS